MTLDLWSSGWYGYDGAGDIHWIGNTSYVYDDLQQLRTASNAVGTSFNATTTNYDAFGNILPTTQSFCGNNIRCGGSTSLARKVDSAHNHYTDMTYDPKQPLSWSLYFYARNNPINEVDPIGLAGVEATCAPLRLALWQSGERQNAHRRTRRTSPLAEDFADGHSSERRQRRRRLVS